MVTHWVQDSSTMRPSSHTVSITYNNIHKTQKCHAGISLRPSSRHQHHAPTLHLALTTFQYWNTPSCTLPCAMASHCHFLHLLLFIFQPLLQSQGNPCPAARTSRSRTEQKTSKRRKVITEYIVILGLIRSSWSHQCIILHIYIIYNYIYYII